MVNSISTYQFIWKLFFSKERFGILWIRGGLGNQLFQISALSHFSDQLDFIPIIHPHNVRQARDQYHPQYRCLQIEELFSSTRRKVHPSDSLELIIFLIYRILRKFIPSAIYNESRLKKTTISDLPRLFFIQDYFESQEYPDYISKDVLQRLVWNDLQNESITESRKNFKSEYLTMIHIRLTDSPNKTINNNLYKQIESFLTQSDSFRRATSLDIFSDDIALAKELLKDIFVSIHKNYPEESITLPSSTLLRKFIQYNCIIASKSTLSWWACYLSSRLSFKQVVIFADFDSTLMRPEWTRMNQ